MKTGIFALLAALCMVPAAVSAFVPEGQPAPQVNMKLLKDGAESDFPGFQSYKGKVVVLEFWATWCDGCVANLPHMDDLVKAFEGKPVVFISATGETAAVVKDFMKTHPMAGAIAIKAGEAAKAFGVSSMPQTVLLDGDGKVLRYTFPDMLTEEGLGRLLEKGSADGIPALYHKPSDKKEEKKDAAEEICSVSVTRAPEKEDMTSGYGTRDDSAFLDYHNLDLGTLLSMAYGLTGAQVEVSTALPTARYDFKVLGPIASKAALTPLMQQTIRTVYGADMRLVKKDKPVLLLKYDKAAPRPGFKPAALKTPLSYGNGFFRSAGATVKDLVGFLQDDMGQPVLDETGLAAFYDVKLTWKGDRTALQAAMKEQLGLTLEPATRAIDVLEVFPAEH